MENEIDYVLEGLSEQELKDTVVKNVEEMHRLKEDAKLYSKAARETIKALDMRVLDCLELVALKRAERLA